MGWAILKPWTEFDEVKKKLEEKATKQDVNQSIGEAESRLTMAIVKLGNKLDERSHRHTLCLAIGASAMLAYIRESTRK